MKENDNVHTAYMQLLYDIWFTPEYKSAPRGLSIREITNYTFTVLNPVSEPVRTFDYDRNIVIADYTAKELELYKSCSNKVEDFAKASKFWEKLANPDGTVNSAYGYLIWKNKSHGDCNFEWQSKGINSFNYSTSVDLIDRTMRTPWEWAKLSLEQDKDTRQAILRFSLPEHQWVGNKDQTCTIYGNFLIREDKLHFTVVMRSNDAVKGTVYDVPFFIHLMDKMVEELQSTYPTLTKGNYTHIANSMHIYERDENTVLNMLGFMKLPKMSET